MDNWILRRSVDVESLIPIIIEENKKDLKTILKEINF
jgi:hypothetical protein